MKKIISISAMFFLFVATKAQKLTPEDYIKTYKDLAIAEMKRTGVPASIKLAQGLLETEFGNSDLVKRSNNHFGIKCKSNWTGESVTHDDDAIGECFRKYPTASDSYIDHSNFLKNSARYAKLFTLQADDYVGWAKGLKACGYATNPRYPQILITNIEKYGLHQYDLLEPVEVTKVEEENLVAEDAKLPTNEKIEVVEADVQPLGGSRFNGIKAVYATKGTSLLALASKHKVKLSKILKYNDFENDGLLDEDQWVYLEEKVKEGVAAYYTTQQDQTLRKVSQITGVMLATLMELNNKEANDIIAAGTKLRLKENSTAFNSSTK